MPPVCAIIVEKDSCSGAIGVFIKQVELEHLRGFSRLRLTLPDATEDGNWIVLLGENGVGKTTILRAIALALSTQRMASRLVDRPREWLRHPDRDANCRLVLCSSAWDADQRFPQVPLIYRIGKHGAVRSHGDETVIEYLDRPDAAKAISRLTHCLVAGYGAYRRPTLVSPRKRDQWADEMFVTLFDDEAGIMNLEEWLLDLDYRAAKSGNEESRAALEVVRRVVNSLMPDGQHYELQIDPDGVVFTGPGGKAVPLSNMSEGFRVIFALGADLVRRLSRAWEDGAGSAGTRLQAAQGIVLIDEVDAHLHPKWQREIGFYLQRIFPRVQFIVATHSPFVAQAASPDGVIVLRQNSRGEVEVDDSVSTLRGLSATDILQSRAFDLESVRDLETEALLKEHAALSLLRDAGRLSAEQGRRLETLEQMVAECRAPAEAKSDVMAELDRVIREVRQRHG